MAVSETITEAAGSGVYLLNRDWSSSARLSFQHWVLKLREGWLLHPTVKAAAISRPACPDNQVPGPLRIADVCAGNCIWSMEILTELPDAKVTAFDISTDTFPTAKACPSNLRLETWNIFDPVPEKYLSYFDVVHIRFVLGVLHKGGCEDVIRRLVSMLKPGGWIQWQDAYAPGLAPIDLSTGLAVPEAELPKAIHYLDEISGVYKGNCWVPRLADLLRSEGGCEETELHKPPIKTETLKYESDAAPWLFSEILKGPMAALLTTKEGRQKREELAKAMDEETALIASGKKIWSYFVVIAIGRKPRSDK